MRTPRIGAKRHGADGYLLITVVVQLLLLALILDYRVRLDRGSSAAG